MARGADGMWCGLRHWFAYYGMVGSSSPVCVRCGAPNPNYRPDDDPKLIRRPTRGPLAPSGDPC